MMKTKTKTKVFPTPSHLLLLGIAVCEKCGHQMSVDNTRCYKCGFPPDNELLQEKNINMKNTKTW